MSIVIDFLMGDYTGCVGDAVTGQILRAPFIFFKTEYRSCRCKYWIRYWQRFVWHTVRCCCHTLRSWLRRHRHCHRQRLLCLRQYLSFVRTFRVTYYKRSSRFRYLQRSCSWRFTNQSFLWFLVTVANIGFAVDVVETRQFQTSLATVVEFTRLQRVYNFEREL